jgi:1,4-dihydroxy-2-naphthoate octaprenyltransferase
MSLSNALPAPSSLFTWLLAVRPRTLSLSLAPVVVGAALAWAETGRTQLPALTVALLCSICIQIAVNLLNDAMDFERGGDGPDRIGPARAAASGLIASKTLIGAAFGFFGLAALGGLYLIWLGGWPILALGLLSLASGWAYAGGPRPISHTPFGELFVIAFFGLGAVGGTYCLCAGAFGPAPLIAGLALGLFASGVLMVNNVRDALADARVGRRTLAIVAGPWASRWIFAFLMLAPFALLGLLAQPATAGAFWLAFGALPFTLAIVRRFFIAPPDAGLNQLLANTAQAQAMFSMLLCLGALL